MRHHLVSRFAFVLFVLMAVSGSAAAQCSLATVRGAWAFQNRGTAMLPFPGSPTPLPVPFVSMGTMRANDQGEYTMHATLSVGGQVQEVDLTGTIQVNPDCTGRITDSFGGAARLVIFDNGAEMRMMPTRHPLGPVTTVSVFRRMSRGEPSCSPEMVRGAYGGTAEGTYMVPAPGQPQPVPAPFSGIFSLHFGRGGTGVGAATASLGGMVASVEFGEMSMVVNRDCTATLSYRGVITPTAVQASGTIKYIVLNHGDELIGMEVESSVGLPVELETHKRISPRLRWFER